ncbi:hypothetical protein H4Q26_017408 [Puccinia striiformis f. sp. tritici PST-130]|uniref:Uncharacterized protein n=1 Tax=Puccinia striiformis f. sp. tritici PST-78 TaxID=1165861 RepID=A0A0L0V5V3_9BASI|nr:hypothetical protein H4Q26_017408 [Puccinia striiformis f. sp. tritici PST-130]KNE94389.1 hypothetical protein PSTG_12289 [Puccinia striiformis f. sp. tritici PST-78]
MGNVRYVIPTFHLKPWLGAAMSVILVLMGENVSSVVALVSVMLTIGEARHGGLIFFCVGTECTRLEKIETGVQDHQLGFVLHSKLKHNRFQLRASRKDLFYERKQLGFQEG